MDPVCVVLPTYQRRHVLERTIGHYLAMSLPLVVVDDGSSDGTGDWLRGLGVRVVAHGRRRGLPAARNSGLRATGAEWVLFGEDDVLFAPGYVETLRAAAARRPRVGAIAGQLYPGASWELPSARPPAAAGPLLAPRPMLADFAARLAGATVLPSLHACALVRRAQALAIGGYDESFHDSAFREESDFYARLWRSGWGCWMTPATWAVHVRHRLGGGCRGDDGLARKLANRLSYWRNNARFVDRHRRLWSRWGLAAPPGRIKLDYARKLIADGLRAGLPRPR